MNQDQSTPEKWAEQLADNTAALIQADLALKAAHQQETARQQQDSELLRQIQAKLAESNPLLRQVKKQLEANRQKGQQWALLALLAVAGTAAVVLYLLYPKWLPEQFSTLSSFTNPE